MVYIQVITKFWVDSRIYEHEKRTPLKLLRTFLWHCPGLVRGYTDLESFPMLTVTLFQENVFTLNTVSSDLCTPICSFFWHAFFACDVMTSLLVTSLPACKKTCKKNCIYGYVGHYYCEQVCDLLTWILGGSCEAASLSQSMTFLQKVSWPVTRHLMTKSAHEYVLVALPIVNSGRCYNFWVPKLQLVCLQLVLGESNSNNFNWDIFCS